MIVREFLKTRKDGVNLYRTYSDIGNFIIQNETGIEYADAIDVEGAPFTYEETDKPIEATTDLINADFISVEVGEGHEIASSGGNHETA